MPEELRLVRSASRPLSPTLRDVLAVIFRQGRLALISFLFIFLAGVLYGLLFPSYEAQMKFLVRRGRIDPLVTPAPTPAPQFAREEISEEELNSEAWLLHDQEILRQVVQETGLQPGGASWFGRLTGESDDTRVDRAVRRLDQHLSVEPARKATLITVKYRSSDPAKACRVLRSLEDAYLRRHQKVRRPSGESDFFEQQAALARSSLDQAERELMEFTSEEGVVSASLERDIALQRLSDAEANELQTRVALSETAKRISTLESKLRSLPERATTQIRNVDNPELLGRLKSKLLELELKRTELLTKFEPSYRLVQEVDQQIAETKRMLAAEDQLPLRDETTALDPNHEWVKSELVKAQVEFSVLSARAQATRTVLTSYRETAHRLADRAIRQEDLIRNIRTAEERYVLYVNKREEARIGDALDQGGILNVAVIQQPAVPALPVRSAWTVGFAGFLLAGTVSTGLAFAVDYLDPAFRTPDEVVSYLGTPVLAFLPGENE